MRTVVVRVSAVVFVVVLLLAVAVVALGDQAKIIPTRSGPVPDVQCPVGVSPAQAFCYESETAAPGAPQPSDIGVPQDPGASDMPYVGP